MKLKDCIVGEKYKVKVTPKGVDNVVSYFENITFLGTKDVSGHTKSLKNITTGYVFETSKGLIILTDYSVYTRGFGNTNIYFTIYSGYNYNCDYEFVD